jgi:hypothetical protein
MATLATSGRSPRGGEDHPTTRLAADKRHGTDAGAVNAGIETEHAYDLASRPFEPALAGWPFPQSGERVSNPSQARRVRRMTTPIADLLIEWHDRRLTRQFV